MSDRSNAKKSVKKTKDSDYQETKTMFNRLMTVAKILSEVSDDEVEV
jgi:hypothetical protein